MPGGSRSCPRTGAGAPVASLAWLLHRRHVPGSYRAVFIAEHAPERSTPPATDYLGAGKGKAGYTVFAEGWLKGISAWGRPVDLEVMRDGSLLVSDDKKGAIYRITYSGKSK